MNPETSIVRANAAFSRNLYEILSRKQGNVFVSPMSAHALLSMLFQGAQGDTARALAHTLKTPDVASAAEGYKSAIKRLSAFKKITLLMANKIYGVESNKFATGFVEKIGGCFDAEVGVVGSDAKKAAEAVNGWVAEKTKGHIKNIVNEAIFRQNLSLVLVNAIYFKGEWVSKFKTQSTEESEFWVDEKTSLKVQMMHQKESYWYRHDEDLDAQIIEMPYKGYDAKMVIILPSDHNIAKLEAKLAQTDLSTLDKNLKLTEVLLYLPKFKMEKTIQLNDVLSEMGSKMIFDPNKADFKGMLDSASLKDNLYVSEVIQKAFIEVNEGGTVAGAATRAAMVLVASPKTSHVVFKVNRPAIFLLVTSHGESKEPNILFYGRLSCPTY